MLMITLYHLPHIKMVGKHKKTPKNAQSFQVGRLPSSYHLPYINLEGEEGRRTGFSICALK